MLSWSTDRLNSCESLLIESKVNKRKDTIKTKRRSIKWIRNKNNEINKNENFWTRQRKKDWTTKLLKKVNKNDKEQKVIYVCFDKRKFVMR